MVARTPISRPQDGHTRKSGDGGGGGTPRSAVVAPHEALAMLAERRHWGMDELPAEITVDALRVLDADGLIEARTVHTQNQARFPGDRTPPIPKHGEWFSPIVRPVVSGGWADLYAARERSIQRHPPEVRVSERGRAELARAQPVQNAESGEYWPASSFSKNMAHRLRAASAPDRRTKRVRTRAEHGVKLYSVDDARRWWPNDVPSGYTPPAGP